MFIERPMAIIPRDREGAAEEEVAEEVVYGETLGGEEEVVKDM